MINNPDGSIGSCPGWGRTSDSAGAEVVGLRPDAQVGLLYSARSKWGLAFQASFPARGIAFVGSLADIDQRSYHRIFEAFYRGTFAAGVAARMLHDEQLGGPDGLAPADVAAELPVLIVPGLLVADDTLLDWLRDYAAAGGHLVIGPRTAYGDAEGRARTDVKPGRLAEAAGVRYQEFSNLEGEIGVVSETDGFDPSDGSAATDWVDGLISEGSKVVLGYQHPHFGQFPAVVSTEYQGGRITTVGTLPNETLAADLVRWLVPPATWPGLPESVTVHSATNAAGRRIHVVHNWSWESTQIELPEPLTDLLSDAAEAGEPAEPSSTLDLGPWDVRVLGG